MLSVYGIKFWLTLDSCTNQTISPGDPVLHIVFRARQLICCKALLNGFVVTGMIAYQQTYYTNIGMKKKHANDGELN